MFYHLLPPLSDIHIVFNLFNYLTFRAAGAIVTSLLIAFVAGPAMIRWLTRLRVGQVVREEGPESHLVKAGTPTMGGTLIILGAVVSTLLWADLTNRYTWVCVIALLWMGSIGFVDDWLKVVRKQTEGLVGRFKMAGQYGFGLALGGYLVWQPLSDYNATSTGVPFFSDVMVTMAAPVFIAFVATVIAGTSNAVNLTDGLDGLATGLSAIAAITFAVFAYLTGRVDASAYLGLFYLPGSGEMTIFAVSLAGAAIGFLWYNAHPASVFMGDTGSLALGGAFGTMAILLKSEFLLVIIGGVFVMETLSVMIQVSWYKYTARRFGTGRRVFRMAPIHHHFEKLGWPETQVVVRFWIAGLLCAFLAISTLKIR